MTINPDNKACLLESDLREMFALTHGVWCDLGKQRVFLTGGTGFFGCWLLESFLYAEDQLKAGSTVTVLTRSPERFRQKHPRLATHPAVTLHAGDIRDFKFPEGPFDCVIHAATPSGVGLTGQISNLEMFDITVEGTRQALEFARVSGVRKFLLTSSGAVYGTQPVDMEGMPEDAAQGPVTMNPANAYGEGKRAAEMLCAIYQAQYGLECKIARCFAFVGPYLPIDTHFAAGNFIRDALEGRRIHIRGDGTPLRSYLYASDLMVWLWTILAQGRAMRPYNVGASEAISILGLAEEVARLCMPQLDIQVDKAPVPGLLPMRYVPDVSRARGELGLDVTVPVAEGLAKTLRWHQATRGR